MKIGYARVSTRDQNIQLQINALEKADCEKIFQETTSGATQEKPVLTEVLSFLRKGDTLVVWRIDRLGRTLKNLIALIQEFEERGIQFVSLNESIDTSTAIGKFFFHTVGAFAEMERELIRERTRAGLEVARARGIKGGRRFKLNSEDTTKLIAMHKDKNIEINDICRMFGITKMTMYNYIRRNKDEIK